jgi:excinuclease ABC subunit C
MKEEGAHLPDLIVIDGGKGQVSHAFAGLSAAGLASDIPMIGIAKRLEEVFRPGRSEPTLIPKASASLHLLQRIRNEAHRFAVTKQRQQRGKKDLKSALLSIDGVGPKTVTKLLTTFGSVKALQSVSEEALRSTVGATTAQKIRAYFEQPREGMDSQ